MRWNWGAGAFLAPDVTHIHECLFKCWGILFSHACKNRKCIALRINRRKCCLEEGSDSIDFRGGEVGHERGHLAFDLFLRGSADNEVVLRARCVLEGVDEEI